MGLLEFRALSDRHCLGIGGEYAAVNSAIDELIPAKYRRRIDLVVNGSFWLGAAAGALAAPVLLDQNLLPVNVGWRLGFGIGGVLGFSILMLRRFVPESPRWLVTHPRRDGQTDRGRRCKVHRPQSSAGARQSQSSSAEGFRSRPEPNRDVRPVPAAQHSRPDAHGSAVFSIQFGLLYVWLDYCQLLSCPNEQVGLYLFPLAIGNFCGPLLLGSLFDTVGRKKMIAGTFAMSGVLLLVTAYMFGAGLLSATTQTIAWCIIFFFASAAASSAYLTASEIFPLETRALAIGCFYALGTAIGGGTSPLLFGWLIDLVRLGA